MIKAKSFSLLLAACLVANMAVPAYAEVSSPAHTPAAISYAMQGRTSVSYYYDQLSDEEKQAYDALYAAYANVCDDNYDGSASCYVPTGIMIGDTAITSMNNAYFAFNLDHQDLMSWHDGQLYFDLILENDYTCSYYLAPLSEYQNTAGDTHGVFVGVQGFPGLQNNLTPDDSKTIYTVKGTAEVNADELAIINEILETAEGYDDYNKIKYFSQAISDYANVAREYPSNADNYSVESSLIFSPFMNSDVPLSCGAYNKAFYYLCKESDINCVLIEGKMIDDPSHEDYSYMWCMVELDGNWYHVDVLQNDVQGNQDAVLLAGSNSCTYVPTPMGDYSTPIVSETDYVYSNGTPESPAATPNAYYYDQLSDEEKQAYDALYAAYANVCDDNYDGSASCYVPTGIMIGDTAITSMNNAYFAFNLDHQDLMSWHDGQLYFDLILENDYTCSYYLAPLSEYQNTAGDTHGVFVGVQGFPGLQNNLTPDDSKTIYTVKGTAEVNADELAIINEILETAEGYDDYNKIKYFSQAISDYANVAREYPSNADNYSVESSLIFSPFMNSDVPLSCGAYNKAFYYLCKESDINCVLIEGKMIDDPSHEDYSYMWCMVELDGNWYHVDVLQNDVQDNQDAVLLAGSNSCAYVPTPMGGYDTPTVSETDYVYDINVGIATSDKNALKLQVAKSYYEGLLDNVSVTVKDASSNAQALALGEITSDESYYYIPANFTTPLVAGSYTVEVGFGTNNLTANLASNSFTVEADEPTVTDVTVTVDEANKSTVVVTLGNSYEGAALEASALTLTGAANVTASAVSVEGSTYTFTFEEDLAAGDYTIALNLGENYNAVLSDDEFTVEADTPVVPDEPTVTDVTVTVDEANKSTVVVTLGNSYEGAALEASALTLTGAANVTASAVSVEGSTYTFTFEEDLAAGDYTIALNLGENYNAVLSDDEFTVEADTPVVPDEDEGIFAAKLALRKDYKYADAGITFEFDGEVGAIIVDEETFDEFIEDEKNEDEIEEMCNEGKLYVGVTAEAPEGAKQVKATVNGEAHDEAIDLSKDGDHVLDGNFIEYFRIADADGSALTERSAIPVELEWLDADGEVIFTTTYEVKVEVEWIEQEEETPVFDAMLDLRDEYAYKEAGISFDDGVITVNKAAFEKAVADKADIISDMTHGEKLYVGVTAEAPDKAVNVYATVDGKAVGDFDLDDEGDYVHDGMFIEYFSIANVDGTGLADRKAITIELEWYGEDDELIATTEYEVSVKVDETITDEPGNEPGDDDTDDVFAPALALRSGYAYAKAGITFDAETGVITIDKKVFDAFVKDKANSDEIDAMTEEYEDYGSCIAVAVTADAPKGAVRAKVEMFDDEFVTDLETDGDKAFYTEYLAITKAGSTTPKNVAPETCTITWMDESGIGFSTTTFELSAEVKNDNASKPSGGNRHEHSSNRGGGGSSAGGSSSASSSNSGGTTHVTSSTISSAARVGNSVAVSINPNSSTTPSEIAKAAASLAQGETLTFRNVVGNVVQAQITVDPAAAANLTASNISLGMKTNYNPTKQAFEKFFNNKVSVLALDQKGSFGMEVKLAAKLDITGMNTTTLQAYSYNPETNTYYAISAKPTVDANGYVHLTTSAAGHIVITDSPLTLK